MLIETQHTSRIDKVARAIILAKGKDPDDMLQWACGVHEAKAAIKAMQPEYEYICPYCGIRKDAPNQIKGDF